MRRRKGADNLKESNKPMTDQERKDLAGIAVRVQANEDAIKEIKEQMHEATEERRVIHKLATSIEVIAERIVQIDNKVDMTNQKIDDQVHMWQRESERIEKEEKALAERIDAVENEPYKRTAKNLNSIWIAVITAVCTLTATTIFTYIMKAAFGGG